MGRSDSDFFTFHYIEITVYINYLYVHVLPISDTHVVPITWFYLEFFPR